MTGSHEQTKREAVRLRLEEQWSYSLIPEKLRGLPWAMEEENEHLKAQG
ncbi:MAG: hypothetical protein P0Y55_00345 [Candidatus Cohnella colombiensis]|uniref:Uncharacterized protein n=1 Tax=Candidatus Cohnella colombiensis TaxID=3121368 RepID=A0AA95EX69_9BACL|nr:MAG: hypothetical protein P0Y55_00345 [Cohnella sp.]